MGYKMKKKPASMRVVKPMPETAKGQTCGECSLPWWNKENLDYKGDVFIGWCRWSQFGKIIDGTGVVYTSNSACEHFEGKGGSK